MTMDLTAILVLLSGYLLGSVPFGVLLTRIAGLGDVRQIGSGNIGATNVLRTGNKTLALVTLILDGAKGATAYLVAYSINPELAPLAGAAAFLGHLYPVYLGFKGGKGVATFGGLLLAMAWPVGLLWAATWCVALAIWRMSSVSGLMAAALAPVYAWIFADSPTVILTGALAVVIFMKHDANIRRLIKGTEPRIGKRDNDTSTPS